MRSTSSRTGIFVLARLIRLPVAATGHFFEVFGRAALGAERLAGAALDQVLGELPHGTGSDASGNRGKPRIEITNDRETKTETQPAAHPGGPDFEERNIMADTNLNDDMVKLIEYAIISIKRREERIIADATDKAGKTGTPMLYLETGRVTGESFSNARIADYVRNHCGKEGIDDIDVDSLRVYYSVVARWPQSSLKYEEKMLDYEQEKVEILRQIQG